MKTTQVPSSINSYDVSQLMAQTRLLAADYRNQTGQALPVTEELARFDAISLLGLKKTEDLEGVDAVMPSASSETSSVGQQDDFKDKFLIKGRVLFKGGKARQKLGKLSLTAPWNRLLMVIYDSDYQPSQIYSIKRDVIEQEMKKVTSSKRGSMTVAKYKAIGTCIWEQDKLRDQA